MSIDLITNPLREGLRAARKPEPLVLVIFGGSGDLARRMLIPSLCRLEVRGQLPDRMAVIGIAHTKRTREDYQGEMHEALTKFLKAPVNPSVWSRLCERLYYISSNFDDPAGYKELSDCLSKLHTELQTEGNTIFYLASPPSFFPPIIEQISKAQLTKIGSGWSRIVIEKPFGRDLKSARELNDLVGSVFDESQIYRVDHYLGKETVQNILVFRFANAIFEPIWNRRYIDHVQITAAETVGIEGRGDYYEEAGALRDMVQNHMLQLISLVAMEPPAGFEPEYIRDEKTKVFRSIRQIAPQDVDNYVVRGQYGHGTVGGKQVPGYRQEEGVAPDSSVETYVAAKFFIDNWRWQEVPFYVRTGKRLSKKKTEIAIHFKPVPHAFFDPTQTTRPAVDLLIVRIAPEEGISLQIETKQPGPSMRPRPVNLDFRYLYAFGVVPAEAYERLLNDCMLGIQTLFARRDAVEAQWAVVTPILEGCAACLPPDFPNYVTGSAGPKAADDLIQRDGRRWRRL